MRSSRAWRIERIRRCTPVLVLLLVAACGQQNQGSAPVATRPAATTVAPPANEVVSATQTPAAVTPATSTAGITASPSSGATAASPATASVAATETATGMTMTETAAAGAAAMATPSAGATSTAATTATPGPGEFSNPVIDQDFPDPGGLKVGDTYYAYATNFGSTNIQIARSKDLVHWEMLGDALPILPVWASPNNTWAPEVIAAADGKGYRMYFTARDTASNKQCVGVATSDKPEGPFKSTKDKPFVCQLGEGGTIDASAFRDGDKFYLYFKNDGNCCGMTTYLYVQELTPDGLSLVGQPTQLVSNDKRWEGNVVEAPEMVKHDGSYYLFFSANNYAGLDYAVGYASCKSAIGPCEDAPENPILKSDTQVKPPVIGPGGESVATFGDETWMLYHAWEVTAAGLGDRRLMWIDRVTWENGKPRVHGPTEGPQKMP